MERWEEVGRIRNWFRVRLQVHLRQLVVSMRKGRSAAGNTNPFMAGGNGQRRCCAPKLSVRRCLSSSCVLLFVVVLSFFFFVDQYEETLLTSAVRLSRLLAPAGCQRFFLPRRQSATQQHESKDTSTKTTKMTIHVMAMEATMSLGHFHSLSNG